MLQRIALVLGASLSFGCALAPTSNAQRLTDNAIEMNTAMRFGRMDIAGDYVKAQAREAFAIQHAGWGKNVRIDDLEYSGMRMKDNDEAETYVTVSWQMVADPTMHETRIVQHWTKEKGKWTVDSEATEGDAGLLVKIQAAPKPGPNPLTGAGAPAVAAPVPASGPAAPAGAPAQRTADDGPPPLPTVQLGPNTKGRYQTRVIYED